MSDDRSATSGLTKEERLWAVLCHLSTFISIFFLANIVVPLIIWMLKRDQSEFIRDQGKEVLNFQISILLYLVISAALTVVLIGIPLLLAVVVFHIVMSIIGAIKAYDGVAYRYPLTIRFL
uniref:DUF4870 domain-containing protein n=1 Tax=Schlesneria paludicola TaxID=360056 RepID=A0A7C4LPE4_9PLAN